MKIRKNVAISESGYIFNPTTGESFSVNPIGIEIFYMIKEGKSYEEISKTILANFRTDEDTFEKDYHDFVGLLNHYLLIEKENEKEN
ncbi:MAG: PqqD family protein [Bacteroidales bacterium]|nr:PqqD family protein [Bacteroidales bacterium]